MKKRLYLAVAAIAAILLFGVSTVLIDSTPAGGRVVDIDLPGGG
jgi:hypothetical protein